ncbi:SMC5-SMC6 complex localization factor protein 2 isoform X2 [Lepisosteus oculatus]|uniref:SMC5-SMC6 complex localization factor protein 2 isoform X2 n=1 Tax=Lepisosteus oculatus TaxID=7918 RepID=UPI0037139FA3
MTHQEQEGCLTIQDSGTPPKIKTMTDLSRLRKYLSTVVKDLIPLGTPRRPSSDAKADIYTRPGIRPSDPPMKPRPSDTLPRQSVPTRSPVTEQFSRTTLQDDTPPSCGSTGRHAKVPSVVVKKVHLPTSYSSFKVGENDKITPFSPKAEPSVHRNGHCGGMNGEQMIIQVGPERRSPSSTVLDEYHRERKERWRLKRYHQSTASPGSPHRWENGSLEHKRLSSVSSKSPDGSSALSPKTAETLPCVNKLPTKNIKKRLFCSPSPDRHSLPSVETFHGKRKRDLVSDADGREGKKPCLSESSRGGSDVTKSNNLRPDFAKTVTPSHRAAGRPAPVAKCASWENEHSSARSLPSARESHGINREMKENHRSLSDALKRKAKPIDHKELKTVLLRRMAKVSKGGSSPSSREEGPRRHSNVGTGERAVTQGTSSRLSLSSPEHCHGNNDRVKGSLGETLHKGLLLSPSALKSGQSPPPLTQHCHSPDPEQDSPGGNSSSSPGKSNGSTLETEDPSTTPRPLSASTEHQGGQGRGSEDRASLEEWWESMDMSVSTCLPSSDSESEDEGLLSLEELLARSTRPPATPEKSSYSEPSTPVSSAPDLLANTRPLSYKNSLERLLKEKEQDQRVKDIEMKLILSCKEDILKLTEEVESGADEEESILQEHRDFVQKFSIIPNAIPDLHPGEEIFTLSNFGKLFNQHSLDLRKCGVILQNDTQKIFMQVGPDEQTFLISLGLLSTAYHTVPCHPTMSRWLFKMMSVHPDRRISTQILCGMKDIAVHAACQIVERKSRRFLVWTPSIQDVLMVFLNMGASFASLFPLETLQPNFSEGDLIPEVKTRTKDLANGKEHCLNFFPEHNFVNVIKYLVVCTSLCPKAYSDRELLLLLSVVCRVSLEKQLCLLPVKNVSCLLHYLLKNMRDWDTQLPQVCLTVTDLAHHHHNLRRLVHILPDSRRGKLLRKHLSLSVISKILNNRCTYEPKNAELQLSELRPFLSRMKPSSLSRNIAAEKRREAVGEGDQVEAESSAGIDQQAYYLCSSLLALTNEVSNYDSIPPEQRDQLRILSAELDKHIKCDIRESDKLLYRSKVKDFVARIYTRWQVLLQKSRPQQGKLYDYWEPPPEDAVPHSIEEEEEQKELLTTKDSPQMGLEEAGASPVEVERSLPSCGLDHFF